MIEKPTRSPSAVVRHRVRLVVRGLHVRLPQVHDVRRERAREALGRLASNFALDVLPPLLGHVRPHRAGSLQRSPPLRLHTYLQGEPSL